MKNQSKFFWIYCIVLFTSAFVLISLSAISQSRLSKDVETYRQKLDQQEGLYKGAQKSLITLNKENQELSEKVTELEEQMTQLQEETNKNKDEITRLQEENNSIRTSVDHLLRAEEFYKKGNYIESAKHLIYVNYELLSEGTKKIYDIFGHKVLNQAALKTYNQGYQYYKNKNYNEAIKQLNLSLQFRKDIYFSDDAMYFLAMSYFEKGDIEEAKKTLLQIQEQYPDSTYMKAVEQQLEKISLNNESNENKQ